MTDSNNMRKIRVRIPSIEIRQALVDGFRNGKLPAVPEAIVHVFSRVDERARATLLRTLLQSVGPLGLGVLAAGQFAKYMFRERWSEVSLPEDELRHVTEAQVAEIARYVEQSDPSIVSQLSAWLASDSTALVALGAGTIVLLLRLIAERRRCAVAGTPSNCVGVVSDPDWLDD